MAWEGITAPVLRGKAVGLASPDMPVTLSFSRFSLASRRLGLLHLLPPIPLLPLRKACSKAATAL
jgi:hypothetical protein